MRYAPSLGLTLVALAAACATTTTASRAWANGRFPAASQLLVAPDRPATLVVRTTFGLLFSQDAGSTWDWVCERAVGYTGVQDPTLGLLERGTIIAGLAEGLARSTDSGCNWAFADADLGGSPIVDLPTRAASALAASHAMRSKCKGVSTLPTLAVSAS
jgi:hypothetical protein